MKYAIFVFGLMAILPLAGWLRRNRHHASKVWIAMGVLPFVISGGGVRGLYIALISWAGWPGYVKGLEVSVIDLLALAIFLSQKRAHRPLPFRFSMLFYFFAVLLSAFQAEVPVPTIFYAWQIARMFLVYSVVARASSDYGVVQSLLTGLTIGVWVAAGAAAWERVAHGVLQAGGILGDKNLLGLMAQFVGLQWFALLLAGERGRMPYLAPLGSAIAAVLTVSRAAIGLTGIGIFLMFVLSALRKWTSQKAKIALLCAVALLVLMPIALFSLESRFKSEPVSAYDERAAFEKAATLMLSDHPMGVGANNYVVRANTGEYNSRAGVAAVTGSLSTNVHNLYLLTAAETGYVGLVALVFLLLSPLTVAFRCGWRNRRDRRGDLLLGLGVTLLVIYLHSFFEWIFVEFPAQYLFAITAGLVAGLADQLGYWGPAQADGPQAASSAVAGNSDLIRSPPKFGLR